MKPEQVKPRIEPLSERIRARLRKAIGSSKPCPTCGHAPRGQGVRIKQISGEIGIAAATITSFIKGSNTSSSTLDLISAWLDERANGGSA